MQRDERTLVEKLTDATQMYIDKYKKFSPEAVKEKSMVNKITDFFSNHGVVGYNRAIAAKAVLDQMTGISADNHALYYIYLEAFSMGKSLYQSKELKNTLLTICANHLGFQSLDKDNFAYALISRRSGQSIEAVKGTLKNQTEKVSTFMSGIAGDLAPTAAELHEAALSKWIDELYVPRKVSLSPSSPGL